VYGLVNNNGGVNRKWKALRKSETRYASLNW
jgi:hypothetical protein